MKRSLDPFGVFMECEPLLGQTQGNWGIPQEAALALALEPKGDINLGLQGEGKMVAKRSL